MIADGTRVVIAAGADGIGRAMADAFAAQGARIAICDVDPGAVDRFRADYPGAIAAVAGAQARPSPAPRHGRTERSSRSNRASKSASVRRRNTAAATECRVGTDREVRPAAPHVAVSRSAWTPGPANRTERSAGSSSPTRPIGSDQSGNDVASFWTRGPALDPALDPDHVIGRGIAFEQDGGWRTVEPGAARLYARLVAWHALAWSALAAPATPQRVSSQPDTCLAASAYQRGEKAQAKALRRAGSSKSERRERPREPPERHVV